MPALRPSPRPQLPPALRTCAHILGGGRGGWWWGAVRGVPPAPRRTPRAGAGHPPRTALRAAGRSPPPAGGPPSRPRPRPGPSSAAGTHGGTRPAARVVRAPAAELRRESSPPSAPLPRWSPDSRGGKCAKLQLSGVVAPAAEAVSPARKSGSGAGEAAGKCPEILSQRSSPEIPDSPPSLPRPRPASPMAWHPA